MKAIFDFETNGFAGSAVLSATIVIMNNENDVISEFDRYYHVPIGENINLEALKVHGLSPDVIDKKRGNASYPQYFKDDDEIQNIFKDPSIKTFIAHNIAFDSKFVYIHEKAELFCTMKDSKYLVETKDKNGNIKNPKLAECIAHFGINTSEIEGDYHSSIFDVKCTAELYKQLKDIPAEKKKAPPKKKKPKKTKDSIKYKTVYTRKKDVEPTKEELIKIENKDSAIREMNNRIKQPINTNTHMSRGEAEAIILRFKEKDSIEDIANDSDRSVESLKEFLYRKELYTDRELEDKYRQKKVENMNDGRAKNSGLPWTDSLKEKMFTEFEDGATIKELSQTYYRSEGSIKTKIKEAFDSEKVPVKEKEIDPNTIALDFGKYKGRTIGDIPEKEKEGYISWIVEKFNKSSDIFEEEELKAMKKMVGIDK